MNCIDKKGCPFEVRAYRPEDYSHLAEMYDAFSPKAKFQGVPPYEKEVCEKWIKGLIEGGDNFLAWQEGRVIGHGAVLPDFNKGDAEFLIFVSQFHQERGVGSALTRAAVARAESLRLKTVWLTVDAYNFKATRLYKKIGFEFCESYCGDSERLMIYACGWKNDT